jgi:hypothetical protein
MEKLKKDLELQLILGLIEPVSAAKRMTGFTLSCAP